jgi:phosphate:Na+ symporter
VGDHSTNLVELYQYLKENNLVFSPSAMIECKEMFDLAILSISCSIRALKDESVVLAKEVLDLENKIDELETSLRTKHIARLNAGTCDSGSAVVFIDILSNLERVGDHTKNLAMVVFDIERVKKPKKSAAK